MDSERRRAEQTLHALEAQKKVVRQQAIDTAGGGDVAATLQAMLKLDALGDEVVAATGVLSEADKTLEWAKHALGEAQGDASAAPR